MRFVSPLVLALMLGTAGISITAVAPSAAAKDSGAKAPKLKLSPEVLPPLQKVQEATAKKDVEGAKAALAVAEPLLKTNDDRYQFYALMLNVSVTANDPAMQGKALSGMLDTGLVPEAQQGQFSAVAANNELNAKNYDKALERAQKAQALGWKPGEVFPIIAQAYWGKAALSTQTPATKRALIQQGLAAFRQGIDAMKASGVAVPTQWYQVGAAKAESANLPEIKDWAALAFDAEPSGENLRTVLRVFQRTNTTITNRENLDILRLMNISGGLTIRPDFLEYAEMAFKSGVYGEVKTAIEAGRAKGQLNPSDGSDFYTIATQRTAADKASLGAGERDAAKSPNGKVAAATADAYLGYGDYAKAAALYRLSLEKGGVDAAEANTRLGIALYLAKDQAGAKDAFSKVVGGSRGEIARYWLQWTDKHPAA